MTCTLAAAGARRAGGGTRASVDLATGRFAALAAAWADGDLRGARELGHALARLLAAAFAEPNPAVLKGALHALGRIPTAQVRLPLLPARVRLGGRAAQPPRPTGRAPGN